MNYWIRVNGLPLAEQVSITPPQWELAADGGCGQASFTVGDSLIEAGCYLVPGANVEILRAVMPVYSGKVDDFDPQSGEVACIGYSSDAANYVALDNAGNTTRSTDVASYEAALRGWAVVNRSGTFGTLNGDNTEPRSVADLMSAYAEETAQRWGVSARRTLFLRSDPTTPRWSIAPGAVQLGGSAEGAVSHYVVLFYDGTNYQKVIVPHPKASRMPRHEDTLNLAGEGVLTLAQAQARANGRHAMTPAGLAWSTGATISRSQITTIGDTPADLASVQAGQMVRVFASAKASPLMPSMWVDAVIGKTSYTAGESSLYLEPANKAPRGLEDVVAAS